VKKSDKQQIDDLEKTLVHLDSNLNKAQKAHNNLVNALIQIIGEDHEASKRLIESSDNFWKSLDQGNGQ